MSLEGRKPEIKTGLDTRVDTRGFGQIATLGFTTVALESIGVGLPPAKLVAVLAQMKEIDSTRAMEHTINSKPHPTAKSSSSF